MKLLVITSNPIQYGISNFDYLLEELKTMVDLVIWTDAGELNEILKHIGQPDFILINEPGEGAAPCITGIDRSSIPLGIYLSDLQSDINIRKQLIEKAAIKYVFSRYRDRFYEWYPQFYDRLLWLPQHVNEKVFQDYGLCKDIDYLLTGWIDEKRHPLRKKIMEVMKGRPGFVSQVYHCMDMGSEERISLQQAANWAWQLNRAKIFFACDTVCRYPLSTYYAVLACNTLLMAPASRELRDLGFVEGQHFVAIDEYMNVAEKAEYYLAHENERVAIARRGWEMVNHNHTTRIRAYQLVELITGILGTNSILRAVADPAFP